MDESLGRLEVRLSIIVFPDRSRTKFNARLLFFKLKLKT
jgi:hypothetical protein